MKPSAPVSSSWDEQARLGDAGDAAGEACADAVAQPVGDEPVDGRAFGLHGLAFGRGDLRADRLQLVLHRLRQAVVAEIERADQAADGR